MDAGEERPFGFWTATAFVIGGMIGAGIFVLPSQLAPYGWTGVAAWIIGGSGAMIIATVLSALATARPDEPGVIAIIGQALGPVAGVLVGWGAWVSYWCANAYIALTAVRYASQFWPYLAQTPLHAALAAGVLIAVLCWINLAGLKASGRFAVVTVLVKLLPLVAVLIIAAMLLLAGGHAFVQTVHPPLVPTSLFTATTLAMAAIIGFESVSVAAQRVRNPARNVPRATLFGVMITTVVYLVVCTTIVFVLPITDVAASNAPIALFVGHFWGSWAGLAVAGFAVISGVGCLNVWVMMQGEVPLGLVRGGLLPGWMGRTNDRDIAVAPMLIASTLSIVLLLIASWRGGAAVMDFMLRLTAASGLWIYAFTCVAALRHRIRPVVAGLGLLFSLLTLAGAGVEALVLSISLMLAALPLYWLATRSPLSQPT